MATIINNNEFVLSTDVQNAVNNSAANLGVDTVTITRSAIYDDGQVFDAYDENGDYIFSVDSDAIVFEK